MATISCKICAKSFRLEQQYINEFCKHVGKCPLRSTNRLQERFECSLCGTVLQLNQSFKKHIIKEHLTQPCTSPNRDIQYTPTTSRNIGRNRGKSYFPFYISLSNISYVVLDISGSSLNTPSETMTLDFTPVNTPVNTPSNNEPHNTTAESNTRIKFSDFKDDMLLIASKIFGRMNVSMDAAEEQMKDIGDCLKLAVSFMKSNIIEAVSGYEEAQSKVIQCFKTSENRIDMAINKMNTEQKIKTQLVKKNVLCLPKTKVVSQTEEQEGDKIVKKKIKVTIMPIEHQIQSFLEKPNVLTSIITNQDKIESEPPGAISHFLNGERWQDIKAKFIGKKVIPIFLYNDDFGPDDGLSPHGTSNKVSGYYYSFPTLPVQMASTIDNIFVALMAKSIDIKDKAVGANGILKLLVNELKPLESKGLIINGEPIHIAPVLFCGDNMGLNLNLGFTGHKGFYHCRTCFMHKDKMVTCCKEHAKLIRTKHHYEKCIAALKSNRESFGIQFDTCLNQLMSFDLPLSIIADIMHDLLSGVMIYGLVGILNKAIDSKKFTLKRFNLMKKRMDYGKREKHNKFGPITRNHLNSNNIRCHAREMMSLIKYLPAILSKLLNKTDPLMKYGTLLSELLYLCLKNSYTNEDLTKLEACVMKHNQQFLRLFNTDPQNPRTLPPKAHNLLHYLRIIRNSGPLKQMWSMRFEAKHQEAKAYAKVCRSRRNICYSIGKKFCFKNAAILLQNENQLKKITDFKKSNIILQSFSNDIAPLKSCSNVKYKGKMYFVGDYILSDCGKLAYKILALAVDNDADELTIITGIHEVLFNKNLRLYKIIKNNHVNTIKKVEEFKYPPVNAIRFNGHYNIACEEF